MTDEEVRAAAQKEAEKTFADFMLWSKRTTYTAIAMLLIVASCNFGVEDDTYPAYNGEQYNPSGLNVKK
tara:strand:+ start:1527 stop:1733 length:207 start_codon:yes stop_codon:yes gene_type:complete